jgi:hypothetical protein
MGTPIFNSFCGVEYANLPRVVNHPRLGNCTNVTTSIIVSKMKDGSIETLNTFYRPYKENFEEVEYERDQIGC